MRYLYEFFIFGLKEARAAIFAGSFFVLLFLSNHIPLYGIARYDFLFFSAVLIQIILYLTKIETRDEIKVILVFHVLGFILESYKTHPSVASWSYPEEAFFKLGTVPLYSGFMYAAIGSYISQAWRILKVRLVNFDNYKPSIILMLLIYLNFFTNHFIYDFRWFLVVAVFVVFFRTKVEFRVTEKVRRMPVIISFLLIAFFIWIAENISSYWGAWQYPNQINTWQVVSLHKITSWFLLVILSFILIADLKQLKRLIKTKA